MAYILGKDVTLHVGDGAGTEVFTQLGGEGSLSITRSSTEVDLSSKGAPGLSTYVNPKVTLAVSGRLKLPDTALERIDTVAKSTDNEVNIKIKRGSTDIFAAAVGIGNFSCDFPFEGAATYSFNMGCLATPTTDDLGA